MYITINDFNRRYALSCEEKDVVSIVVPDTLYETVRICVDNHEIVMIEIRQASCYHLC